jgi:hypothetical protein
VDDAVNRYARELIEAINAAVATDPGVQACRERARAAGFQLELSLEAVVGIKDRTRTRTGEGTTAAALTPASQRPQPKPLPFDITAADRRFLRSLRIAAEEETEAK